MPAHTWVDAAGGFPDPASSTAFYDAMNALSQAVQAANPAYVAPTWTKPTTGTPVSAAWLNDLEARVPGSSATGFNAYGYGAHGDGTSDDTAALTAWLAAATGNQAVLPPGNYRISGPLSVPANTIVDAYGATLTVAASNVNVVTLASGSALRGLTITASTDSAFTAITGIYATAASRFLVRDCTVKNLTGSGISVQNGSSEYLIDRNDISHVSDYGILLQFSSYGRVIGNRIDTANQGIQYWGGDSANTQTLGIHHLVIANNLISNIGIATFGGGIWGSCGQYITVTGNVIDTTTDVGIDFEGSMDCVAAGNFVRNAHNGCFTAVNGSQRITYTGNTATCDSTETNGVGFQMNPSTNGRTMKDIVITGNTISTQASGIYFIGAALSCVVSSNRITASTASTSQPGIHWTYGGQNVITDNFVEVTAGTGIFIEGGISCDISRNYVITDSDTSASTATAGGILIYWVNSTYPAKWNRVKDNTIRGFTKAVFDDCWGDMASYTLIENNVAATVYRKAGTGYTGVINNNRSDATHQVATAQTV